MGLFDGTDEEQKQNLGLLGLMSGLGMMQANQPGASMGQAIGAGGLTGIQGLMAQQKMAQQQKQMEMMNQFRQAQLQQGEDRMVPASVREYQFAKKDGFEGSYEDYRTQVAGRNEAPASWREWQEFNKLSPEDQARYLTMKRQNSPMNLGGQMIVPNQANPAAPPLATFNKTPPPEQMPEFKGAQSQASATGQVIGSQTATAAMGLPQAIAQGEQTTKLVDDILNDPAFAKVVGMPESLSGVTAKMGSPIPGTPEAGFMAKIDQLGGQQFLQAYETLKGSGQITEIEGKKATDAISRMTKTNQSEADYRKAAEEFKQIIQNATNRAKMKAGGGPARPSGATGGWSIQRVD